MHSNLASIAFSTPIFTKLEIDFEFNIACNFQNFVYLYFLWFVNQLSHADDASKVQILGSALKM